MADPRDFDFYCEEALSGKTAVNKVYESEKVLAFHHTKPKFRIHIVIIPKNHIHDLLSLNDSELILEIVNVAKKIAKTLNRDHGIRLITNIGKFQETPHLHFHLVSEEKITPLLAGKALSEQITL